MMTVNEVSKITGINVYTLNYYDKAGLVEAGKDPERNFGLYDDEALDKLHQVLFFLELDFPVKDIKRIMESPGYDKFEALFHLKKILKSKRNRIDDIITLTEKMQKDKNMPPSFAEFKTSRDDAYAEEIKERWGNRNLCREDQTNTSFDENPAMADIFAGFGRLLGETPDDAEVQKQVEKLQKHINDNYYTCTDTVLSTLGEIYASNSKYKSSIDKYGEGTANFLNKAINYYCDSRKGLI